MKQIPDQSSDPIQTQDVANPIHTESPRLNLFVYGSLKRGYWNHDRYCAGAISIVPATTWGRLYELPAGYPALKVPESVILAYGTVDPIADAITQVRIVEKNVNTLELPRPSGDWDLISGELITLSKPLRELKPIDTLEGYLPGGRSLYQRLLIPINLHNAIGIAWAYVMEHPVGCRLRKGIWE